MIPSQLASTELLFCGGCWLGVVNAGAGPMAVDKQRKGGRYTGSSKMNTSHEIDLFWGLTYGLNLILLLNVQS